MFRKEINLTHTTFFLNHDENSRNINFFLLLKHECCYGYTRNPSSRQPGCTRMIMKSLDETMAGLEVRTTVFGIYTPFYKDAIIFTVE